MATITIEISDDRAKALSAFCNRLGLTDIARVGRTKVEISNMENTLGSKRFREKPGVTA